MKDQLLGEAYFLRAYYYHQLLRFYGGVPIIDKPYGLNEDYSIAVIRMKSVIILLYRILTKQPLYWMAKVKQPVVLRKLQL